MLRINSAMQRVQNSAGSLLIITSWIVGYKCYEQLHTKHVQEEQYTSGWKKDNIRYLSNLFSKIYGL